ncbi:phosphopantetheine-binding protein [Actinoplanes sp. NPDC051475]|uniref:thioesterase domain-containing protein n=1 Tax=Actinoplanes sp. NPDC051475 TaxID=3157225 RepID=UPI00344C9A62
MTANAPRDPVEALIASKWSQVTGVPLDSIHDDFFDAGNSSLEALKLMELLREEFGPDLSIDAIFNQPTVAGLAELVRAGGSHRRYAFTLQKGDGIPLILGPGLGGGPAYVSKLAVPELGRPVVSVLTRGIHGEQRPFDTSAETSRHLLSSLSEAGIRGPVHFMGHCMGGLSVLEATRYAAEYDIEVRSVVLINTSPRTPDLTRHEMTKIRLQEIRGFVGLEEDPRVNAVPEGEPLDDTISMVFDDVKDSDALSESSIEPFKVRLDVYVSSWLASSSFTHQRSEVPLHIMYDPDDLDWLYGGAFDIEGWEKLDYPNMTVDARPGMLYANIGLPENRAAVAAYLDAQDAGTGGGHHG